MGLRLLGFDSRWKAGSLFREDEVADVGAAGRDDDRRRRRRLDDDLRGPIRRRQGGHDEASRGAQE